MLFEGDVKGVIELASFDRFSPTHKAFLDLLVESIGIVINTIEANMRTEALLAQSQSLASELGQTNQELQEKAQLLAHQNAEVERKNREVELARQALEEKAAQLALTSKYKSEFLANMSHELRTPLNSLLILSDQLSKNPDGNLSSRQTEFAKTIHASGNDLLNLINDILDLSKIESGTVVVDVGEMVFADLHGFVERTFSHLAEAKGLEFDIQLLPASAARHPHRRQAPAADPQESAVQRVQVHPARPGGPDDRSGEPGRASSTASSKGAARRVAFSVADTGIGIPTEKQQIIFEAFQQADGSTSRTYGGTGLGLAISRELSRLLGGEIHLASAQGHGSTLHPLSADDLHAAGDAAPAGRRRRGRRSGAGDARARRGRARRGRDGDRRRGGKRRPARHPAGGSCPAHRRERHGVRAGPPGRSARAGLQGGGHLVRRRGPRA